MGNSQSIDRVQNVVQEGIKLYQSVTSQQEQEQHGQQHYNQGHYSSSSPAYRPSADIDDEEYASLRAQAREEAEKRNTCYAQSQAAYTNRNGAQAKALSNQGHIHDNLMKQFNQRAADYIYSQKNDGRPHNEIDLHGLFVKEAAEKVEEAINRCQQYGGQHLVIIVGKGLHSPGQIAKLKPAIIELVKKYNVSCQPNIPNPGCLYVEFGKGTGDLSWLDRISDRMSQSDQCIIM